MGAEAVLSATWTDRDVDVVSRRGPLQAVEGARPPGAGIAHEVVAERALGDHEAGPVVARVVELDPGVHAVTAEERGLLGAEHLGPHDQLAGDHLLDGPPHRAARRVRRVVGHQVEVPVAAGPDIDVDGLAGHAVAVGAEPGSQLVGIGEGLPDQVSGSVELALEV